MPFFRGISFPYIRRYRMCHIYVGIGVDGVFMSYVFPCVFVVRMRVYVFDLCHVSLVSCRCLFRCHLCICFHAMCHVIIVLSTGSTSNIFFVSFNVGCDTCGDYVRLRGHHVVAMHYMCLCIFGVVMYYHCWQYGCVCLLPYPCLNKT